MTLALRITTDTAPEPRRRRYVEINNLAEALVWFYSRRRPWRVIAGDRRRLAIVIVRGGGQS